jgi:Ribosomal L30 N-terminal domain
LNKEKRKVIFKRAESYVKEYLAKERDEIRLSREAKAQNSFYVPAESKLAFVIRIKGYFFLLIKYQQDCSKASKDSPTIASHQDQLWNFCQTQQGYPPNAPMGLSIHCLGLSKLEEC